MAAHVHLKNEFTEDEKCHNLMSWLNLYKTGPSMKAALRTSVSLYFWFMILSVSGKLPLLKFRCRYIENKQNLDSYLSFKPPHDKTNKVACAPSEDSDQPGHPPSLIRVFAVRMKKAWVLPIECTATTVIRVGGCQGWSESSLGAQSFCWFCHEVAQVFLVYYKYI